MDKERQIDEIVKIICLAYKDGAKCMFNERQFGQRKCAEPCLKRTEAKQLIDAGYRLTVHGKWAKHQPDAETLKAFQEMGMGKAINGRSIFYTCSVCLMLGSPYMRFCPN